MSRSHTTQNIWRLRNWSSYKTIILLHLECIVYEAGVDSTALDEFKFPAVIQSSTRSDAGRLVLGMKSVTSMVQLFENTYRQIGEVQREIMWESLLELRYNGDCPIDHVIKFKILLREYESTGHELASNKALTLFKVSVREKSK